MTEIKAIPFRYSVISNKTTAILILIAALSAGLVPVWIVAMLLASSRWWQSLDDNVQMGLGIPLYLIMMMAPIFIIIVSLIKFFAKWGEQNGEAVFGEEAVTLQYGKRDEIISYSSIQSLGLAVVNNPRKQGGGYRAAIVQVRISTHDEIVRINVAPKESGDLLTSHAGAIGNKIVGHYIVRNLEDVDACRDVLNEVSLIKVIREIEARANVPAVYESNFRSGLMRALG
ncbi:MAG: hypothetical protein FWG78_00190 [Coriobacteriia bacterium]|nr:hypothetical protein [Coriobacteriia bacterium]